MATSHSHPFATYQEQKAMKKKLVDSLPDLMNADGTRIHSPGGIKLNANNLTNLNKSAKASYSNSNPVLSAEAAAEKEARRAKRREEKEIRRQLKELKKAAKAKKEKAKSAPGLPGLPPGVSLEQLQKEREEAERLREIEMRNPETRRVRNDIWNSTATRAGVCLVPQIDVPVIDTDDPRAKFRLQDLQNKMDEQYARLGKIEETALNGNWDGQGNMAVTTDVLKEKNLGSEFLPKQQILNGGKPWMCRPMKHNELPMMDQDGLFTSTNRADFYWKSQKKNKKRHRRLCDHHWHFRENVTKMAASLRTPVHSF